MINQVFSIVAPLFIIIAVGYFYGARVRPEMQITNRLILDVFMPALIFHVMVKEGFDVTEYTTLISAGVLLMIASGIVALVFSKLTGYSLRAVVPPAMFSNWANLGLPLYVFTLGDQALDAGVMLVVAGNILCFTIGVYIYSGTLSWLDILKTPIIVAVIIGLLISGLNVPVAEFIVVPIEMLSKVAIPLMLFSLGVRLTRVNLSDLHIGLVMAVFCPVVGVALALLLGWILPLNDLHKTILILFGVLPPAIVNFMLAERYNSEAEKVASIVMIGNLASIFTIPLVLFFVLSGQ